MHVQCASKYMYLSFALICPFCLSGCKPNAGLYCNAPFFLGQTLVAWWDKSAEQWRVFADRCPHRLAPLSEGRIEPDGNLMCAYHAWKFAGDGSCVALPQAPESESDKLRGMPKVCRLR